MSTFILILFLKVGYAGGVVTVPYPDYQSCLLAIEQAKKMDTYTDAACINGGAK